MSSWENQEFGEKQERCLISARVIENVYVPFKLNALFSFRVNLTDNVDEIQSARISFHTHTHTLFSIDIPNIPQLDVVPEVSERITVGRVL